MSILIKLFVDDLEFNVLRYRLGILQNADYNGRASNKPNAQPFEFTIEATKHNTFYEWAIHNAKETSKNRIFSS